jgi:hypothetical protein
MRTRMLMIAVVLSLNFPLVVSAVTDSKQKSTGLDRANEVAAERARGLQIATNARAAASVPEPSSFLIFATGALLAAGIAKRRVPTR